MIDSIKKDFAESLALISFSGYVAAYLYEYGVCMYFNIPTSLISISLGNFIFPALTTALSFALVYLYYKIITDLAIRKASKRALNLAKVLSVVVVITNFTFYLIRRSLFLDFVLLGVMIISSSGTLICLEIARRKRLPIQESRHRLVAAVRLKAIQSKKKLNDTSLRRVIALGIVMILGMYAELFGASRARSQTIFPHVVGHKNLLILRQYGDQLICRTYDTKKKIFTDSTVILKVENIRFTFIELKR